MIRSGKLSWVVLLICIAVLGIPTVGYAEAADEATSIQEVKKEASELVEALKNYTADQRDEAMNASKNALDMLDERIDTLESRVDEDWDQLSQAARAETRESLKALRDQRTRAAEWYGSMKTSSTGAWEEMKKGFSNAYGELAQAWEKAEENFSDEKSQ